MIQGKYVVIIAVLLVLAMMAFSTKSDAATSSEAALLEQNIKLAKQVAKANRKLIEATNALIRSNEQMILLQTACLKKKGEYYL